MTSGDQAEASQWIDLELQNAEQLRAASLFDAVIDGEQSTERIAKELLDL